MLMNTLGISGSTVRAAAASIAAVWLVIAALYSTPLAADNARWGVDYFPNVTLTTHEGRTVRFYDDLIKGKIVALDLIYTTCKYACPLETARLAQVQRALGDRVGRDIFFYSITIDPEHDTPQVLKEYAEKYRVGPGWLFLTGSARDIDLISKKLGLYSEPNASNPDGHTPFVLIGNEATGQWMRNSALDNPRFLATTIGEWLDGWKSEKKPTPVASYADTSALKLDPGEYAYASHCAACHTIGRGDAIGPDLRGVTASRERAWLTRFIARPDKILAEGDPIAQALLAKYKGVRMPNLALSEMDASLIVDYLAKQDREGAATPAVASASPAAQMPGPPVDLKPMIEAYLNIQRALNADTIDGVMNNALIIASQSAKIGARASAVRSAINPFAQVKDLAGAREAFGKLSDALIEHARAVDAALGDDVNVAYCPMAKKYWLQQGATIQNPYYGKQMSDCGRIVPNAPPAIP
jgi:protein SCO1/2